MNTLAGRCRRKHPRNVGMSEKKQVIVEQAASAGMFGEFGMVAIATITGLLLTAFGWVFKRQVRAIDNLAEKKADKTEMAAALDGVHTALRDNATLMREDMTVIRTSVIEGGKKRDADLIRTAEAQSDALTRLADSQAKETTRIHERIDRLNQRTGD